MGLAELVANLAQKAVALTGNLSPTITYYSLQGAPVYDVSLGTSTYPDMKTLTNVQVTLAKLKSQEENTQFSQIGSYVDPNASARNTQRMLIPSLNLFYMDAGQKVYVEPADEDFILFQGETWSVTVIGSVPGRGLWIIQLEAKAFNPYVPPVSNVNPLSVLDEEGGPITDQDDEEITDS